MSLQLDHAVMAVRNLNTAIHDYRALGFTVVQGGMHANRATQNALITFLDGTYLELLASTGEPPVPDLVDFGSLVQKGEGLVGFALRSDDLEAEVARLRTLGFSVGDIIPGERRRQDGTTIRWKLALLEGGFAPFLIQDITPRAWRIPVDPALITHPNRAVGLSGVEIAVRAMDPAWERYIRLFGVSPRPKAANYRTVGGVSLNEVGDWVSSEILEKDELPSYLRMFPNVSQAEIDAADPALEPKTFEASRKVGEETLAQLRMRSEQAKALIAAVAETAEALFAVHLVREQGEDDRFTLERTHGVRFRQYTGVPPTRGAGILVGLDAVDWSAVGHAYGPAIDVPDQLRALASDDEAVRRHAGETLNGSITHQGSIYDASIATIPFLLQLLNAPEVEEKPALLDLLGTIVFGGMATPELRASTHAKLRDALPAYLAQLSNPDPQIRMMIAEQLSLYQWDTPTLESLLRTTIESDPKGSVQATCVQTLATLWTATEDQEQTRQFSEAQTAYLARLMRDSAHPLAVQFKAACVLVRNNPDIWLDEVVAFFKQVMGRSKAELKSLRPYWLGGIISDVVEALSTRPDQALEWVIAQAQHPDPAIREYIPFTLERLLAAGPFLERMIPTVAALLRDPSPDVRQTAVGFFYFKPHAHKVIDILRDLAANDPSLTVRVVARNTLDRIPPKSAQ